MKERIIKSRINFVRQKLMASKLDAILISHLPHVRYLTGYTGSNGICLITQDRALFVTDGRYKTQSRAEVKDYRIAIASNRLLEALTQNKLLPQKAKLGFESLYFSVSKLEALKTILHGIKTIPLKSFIEPMMAIKTEEEIGYIKKAVAITDKVFAKLLSVINDKMTELDIAAEIRYLHTKEGSEGDAFEARVASGENGALPHANPGRRKIRQGDLIIIDMGARFNGYHSDLTRTIAIGKIKAEAKKIYTIVEEAQRYAIEIARAGMTAKALDAAARRVIAKNGYGKYFNHSLGHGLGLQIHEAPAVSKLSSDILRNGNVITIEPGIYIPGFGGVRIEDDIVIRNNECEILTQSPKALIQL